jgi:hypothetical protein
MFLAATAFFYTALMVAHSEPAVIRADNSHPINPQKSPLRSGGRNQFHGVEVMGSATFSSGARNPPAL